MFGLRLTTSCSVQMVKDLPVSSSCKIYSEELTELFCLLFASFYRQRAIKIINNK